MFFFYIMTSPSPGVPAEAHRRLLGNGRHHPVLAPHRRRPVEQHQLCDVTVPLLGGNHDHLVAAPRSPHQRLGVVGGRPHQRAERDSFRWLALLSGNAV